MQTPVLEVKELCAGYADCRILQKISFSLTDHTAAIIGRNGMGKTTLMKAIMGILPAESGKIYFHGEDITNLKPHQIAAKGIGYVPQGRHIFSSLTVDEHLKFAARKPEKNTTGWNAERVYEMFPRLKERYKQRGTNLSGGEQQMLAIGRALVLNPSLLIMDEPSEGLAPIIVEQLKEFTHQIAREGIDLILVEQRIDFAADVTDNVSVIVNGEVAYADSFQKLLADKALAQSLISVGV